ncbi:MAG: VanZ family protein [Methyloligellaceae bacterium]
MGERAMDRCISSFGRFAPTLAILYLALLFLLLLYPFNFSWPHTSSENSVVWPNAAPGAQFGKSGMLISAEPPAGLYRRLTSGDGLTVELWLRPASPDNKGTGRIVSYSLNRWERNLALVQQGRDFLIRMRTTKTDASGLPSIRVADVFVREKTQHIVVTYDFTKLRVHVDGRMRVESVIPQGTFENWDPSYVLVFGNEATGGKPWGGTIAYAAIYEKPLSDTAIVSRHEAGHRSSDTPTTPGLLLAYNFAHGMQGLTSGRGTISTISPMPPLLKPARVNTYANLFFSSFDGKMLLGQFTAWDLVRNVILFVPFGFFVFAFAGRRYPSSWSAVLLTVIVASLVSAAFEALQFFLYARTSSIFDFGANTIGALVGAICCFCWFRLCRVR